VHLLIAKGAEINFILGDTVDKEQRVGGPLFTAIGTKQRELVPVLIDLGADVNAIRESTLFTLRCSWRTTDCGLVISYGI
jgi:hypothetical protein